MAIFTRISAIPLSPPPLLIRAKNRVELAKNQAVERLSFESIDPTLGIMA